MTYVVALVLYHSLGVYVGLISPPFAWQSPLLFVVARALASSEASLAYNFILIRVPLANHLMRMRTARALQNFPGRPKQIF